MRRYLTRPLLVLLALVFLVEAWLWSRLAPIVGWIVDRIAWRELREKITAGIERLPPLATLLVFLVPILVLLPIKIFGLWLLHAHHWFSALVVLGLAKIVSVGLTAFIFEVTRPKLLQLSWFRWLYEHVLVWLERAHRLVDPIKLEIKAWIARHVDPIRRRLRSWMWLMKPKRAGRFMRRVSRIRRRMRAQAA